MSIKPPKKVKCTKNMKEREMCMKQELDFAAVRGLRPPALHETSERVDETRKGRPIFIPFKHPKGFAQGDIPESGQEDQVALDCLLYTSPSPRDA